MTALALAVVTVVVVSATCSLFEAVLYSIPVSHIETLASEGKTSGRILRKLRANVEKPITAILSLNTISNTAGAAVAGALAAKALGEDALVYFSAGFTLLILLVSEVMPKTAGVVYAKPLSSLVARPLSTLTWLFAPIVWLCGFATRLISGDARPHTVSEDELRVLARLGHETGAIEETEGRLVDNALTLDRKSVREVMTPRSVVFMQAEEATVADVFLLPEVKAHSRFPVRPEGDDFPSGLVYSWELLAAAATGRGGDTLASLKKPLPVVADDQRLDITLAQFLRQGHHLMGVVGEFGGFQGVITLEDVLEELLGEEIIDETDQFEDLQALARQRREARLERDAGSE